MRKQILPSASSDKRNNAEGDWLDLETLAEVQVSSEDDAHPVESALIPGRPTGWRAGAAGEQKLRLLFDEPQNLSRIRLLFQENHQQRTQEFVLRWSESGDEPFHEIVRQQYHFSPPGTSQELEDIKVDLKNLRTLELAIKPEIGGGGHASLAELRVS